MDRAIAPSEGSVSGEAIANLHQLTIGETFTIAGAMSLAVPGDATSRDRAALAGGARKDLREFASRRLSSVG